MIYSIRIMADFFYRSLPGHKALPCLLMCGYFHHRPQRPTIEQAEKMKGVACETFNAANVQRETFKEDSLEFVAGRNDTSVVIYIILQQFYRQKLPGTLSWAQSKDSAISWPKMFEHQGSCLRLKIQAVHQTTRNNEQNWTYWTNIEMM